MKSAAVVSAVQNAASLARCGRREDEGVLALLDTVLMMFSL